MKNDTIFKVALCGSMVAIFSATGFAADAKKTPVEATPVVAAEATPAVDGKVSVVIDKTIKIMTADVDAMVDAVFKANAASIPEDKKEEAKQTIRQKVIMQLTLQALLQRECDKVSIAVTDKERDDFFAKATGGKVSIADVAKDSNMTVEKFMSLLTTNLRIEKLLNSKIEKIPAPTDAEVKARFDKIVETNPEAVKVPETVSASHILVKVDEKTTDAVAKKKIDELHAKLVAGADFAQLAKENSDCPSSSKGGSLGEFGKGQMVKEFEDAAFSQKVGAVGPVVKTSFGYHIIKVDAKNPAHEVKFDDVKDDILKALKSESANKARTDFIEGVQKAAQIENLEAPVVVSKPVEAPVASEPGEAKTQSRELPAWAN